MKRTEMCSRPDCALPLSRALILLAFLLPGAGPAQAETGLIRYKSGPIAISQDGADLWVVNPDANSVTRIDAGPDTVVAEIAVGTSPRNLSIASDGGEVWVSNYESHDVSVIDASTNLVAATLPTLFGPFGVVHSPDDSKVYVVNEISDSLLTFDTGTRLVIDRDPLAHRPRAIAVTPDGSRVMIQQFVSFQTLMQTSFFDSSGGSLSPAFEVLAQPVCVGDGGYPGVVQAISVAPGDTTLWIPVLDVNPQNGVLNLSCSPGDQLTLESTMQAIVREVRISSRTEINEDATHGRRRLNTAGAYVQMPADVAFTSDGQSAYLPCSFSNDVLKVNTDTNPPTTLVEIDVGDFPNGITISPVADRAYVTNYLSRDVTVIDTNTDTVVGTIAVTQETLSPSILNGKKLFNTATGNMSTGARIACAGCHPEGLQDGANWDFSHFGDGKRNSQTLLGIAQTPPYHTIGDRDELQDFEHNIEVLQFGAGLAGGTDNPPVGPPNEGRSQDLDDLAAYIASLPVRPFSPDRDRNTQALSASAAAGKALFESDSLECSSCHPEPLFTDGLLHDVGTYLSIDTTGYQGFVSLGLRGIYDTDPYLHAGSAPSLQPVLVAQNYNDQHGRTSQLSVSERDDLIAYLNSIVGGLEDTTPPGLEYARAVDLTEVIVRFLEPVDPATAENPANYSIDNGISVLSASVDPFSQYMGRDGLTVHLYTMPHTAGPTYTVTVQGVKDLSVNGNAIPGGGYQASYSYSPQASFTFSNIDSLFTSRLGRDTYVEDAQPTFNYGRSDALLVGTDAATARAMVRFDFFPMLSTVVVDTTDIVSAKIRLRLKDQATGAAETIYAYRLLKYFVQGSGGAPAGQPYANQTTWNDAREGRLPWDGAGASARMAGVEGDDTADYLSSYDIAFSPEDSATVSVVGDWYEWDVTHSVRWAFANPYFWNFGHLLVAANESSGSGKTFYSLEDPVEANRPQLVVTVAADNAVSVGPASDPGRLATLAPARPNPTRGATTFSFSLPRAELVTLKLFDVSGRTIRTLADRRFTAGAHEVAWDGRSDAGRRVAAGSYFYRIKAGQASEVGRLVLVR